MFYLEKRSKEDTKFLAMLAHDLKTPIKAEMQALSLLYGGAYGSLGEEVENILKNIIASNKYTQTLIDNLLSEYRITSGVKLNKTKNDIRRTLEEALLFVGILFDTKEQTISIKYLSDCYLCFYDEVEIKRVLINLLTNAFEYSKEKSEILITVSKEESYIKIQIYSSALILKKPYPNLKSSTGLGFQICKLLIEMHGGMFAAGNNGEDKFISGFTLPLYEEN